MLRFRNLGSGSTGNATLVEARGLFGTARLLVDCGLGIRVLEQRLSVAGVGLDDIDAIFVTHEHSDHIGCAHSLARRRRIPVWMSRGTYAAIGEPDFDGLLKLASDGVAIDLGELQLHPFAVPHDAREPLQLRCSDGDRVLGIVTDLGHGSEAVVRALARCHALLLESNHCPDLLAASAYPHFLKLRVGGRYGHLSNGASAELARALVHPALHTVVAAHLSAKNNRAELARAALAPALGWEPARIGVASPLTGTDWLGV